METLFIFPRKAPSEKMRLEKFSFVSQTHTQNFSEKPKKPKQQRECDTIENFQLFSAWCERRISPRLKTFPQTWNVCCEQSCMHRKFPHFIVLLHLFFSGSDITWMSLSNAQECYQRKCNHEMLCWYKILFSTTVFGPISWLCVRCCRLLREALRVEAMGIKSEKLPLIITNS